MTKPLSILVVEDDVIIAYLLAETLESMGHTVCAIEGTQAGAITAAQLHRPDLMIVDDRLGEGSGLAVVEAVLRSGPTPHILVSGDTVRIKRLMPDAVVLEKPYNETDLARAIRSAVIHPESSEAAVTIAGGQIADDDHSSLIVAIAERNDRVAFATLFSHFAPRIKSYMLRLGASDQLAEDLAQETLLTVWRRAPAYDHEHATLPAWIFCIARDLRIDLPCGTRLSTRLTDPSLEQPNAKSPGQILLTVQDETRVREVIADPPLERARAARFAFFRTRSISKSPLPWTGLLPA